MTNLHKALQVLNKVDDDFMDLPENTTYAHALEAAGLLAPDLPKPDSENGNTGYWDGGCVQAARGSSKVRLYLEDPRMTPWDAKQLAYALLAASKYTEQEPA